MKPALVLALALACTGPAALAQHQHPHAHGGQGDPGPAAAPYAGLQQREIKALSAQQMADLQAGKGMALALPAELNGYPGPAHVLELATPLGLSADQQARTQSLFERMQAETRVRGQDVIAAERALDALFKNREATPEGVSVATQQAAQAAGRLRDAHLRYHLAMRELLTPEQVAAYNRLRGY